MAEPVIVWSRPEAERAGTPLVVALHGRGADESSMRPLFDHLPAEVTVAAPRGHLEVGAGSYTWFENRGIGRPVPASLDEAVALWSERLAAIAADHASVTLLGFSGGALMAGALMLTHPARYVAGIFLSGTLPWETGVTTDSGRLSGQPVFWGLDPADDVIPGDLLRRSEAWLRDDSGARLEAHAYAGQGHSISAAELADISRFLVDNVI